MTAWEELRETCLKCQACQLRQTCTQVVFGVGDPNAEVLFIGEAPGANEDAQGEPFVGRAGKLLDDMLAMIGLPGRISISPTPSSAVRRRTGIR